MRVKNILIDYCNKCISGEIKSGKKHIWACTRLLKDFNKEENDPTFKYHWHEDEAEKIITWFTYLRHSKGILAGTPIYLTDWQKFIVCPLYAWLDENGNRRFKKCFIEVGRKNAKSQLVGGVQLYESSYIATKYNEMMENYCAAVKKEQAKIVFTECDLMLIGSPLRPKFNINKVVIEHRKTRSFIKPLSKEDGKKGDGTNPNTTCLDEYHLHSDTGYYDMHETGARARQNSLLFIITTAGFDLNCPCYQQEYKYCENILNPDTDISNDKYWIDICEMDKGDELTFDNIMKANPILSTYELGRETIKDSFKEAIDVPEKMTAFLTKTCNIWLQSRDDTYIPMDKFKKCEVKLLPWNELKGKECYIGLDMSAKIDLTSIAIVIPVMEDVPKYYLFSHSFIPTREKLMMHVSVDKAPYDTWERLGYITITNSPIVDQEQVIQYVINFCKNKGLIIKQWCFDPANASKMMMDLSNRGHDVVEVFQSQKHLNEPTCGFREQVYCENIVYEVNPVLNFAMVNAVVKSYNGLIKIDKDATRKRIDPLDATLGAFKLAMYHEFNINLEKYLSDDYLNRLYGNI